MMRRVGVAARFLAGSLLVIAGFLLPVVVFEPEPCECERAAPALEPVQEVEETDEVFRSARPRVR